MTITTSASHGLLIEALSRVSVLVREHREELPELQVYLASDRSQIDVLVVERGATEPARRSTVERLARLLKLDEPKQGRVFFQTGNHLWHVYTPVETD
ncbi:MAG: hypothetical protein ACRDP8_15405 [Actinopolymorphaceae bacterium]